MKMYFIYKRIEGLEPALYALTDNKEYKNIFMSERKPEMFTCIKKEIDENTYRLFKDRNYHYFLDRRGYATRPSSNPMIFNHVNVVSTYEEEMRSYIDADMVFKELGKYTNPFCKSFNSELLKALDKIGYFQIYKYNNLKDSFVEGIDSCGIKDFPLREDVFGVFLHLYGNTFNKK